MLTHDGLVVELLNGRSGRLQRRPIYLLPDQAGRSTQPGSRRGRGTAVNANRSLSPKRRTPAGACASPTGSHAPPAPWAPPGAPRRSCGHYRTPLRLSRGAIGRGPPSPPPAKCRSHTLPAPVVPAAASSAVATEPPPSPSPPSTPGRKPLPAHHPTPVLPPSARRPSPEATPPRPASSPPPQSPGRRLLTPPPPRGQSRPPPLALPAPATAGLLGCCVLAHSLRRTLALNGRVGRVAAEQEGADVLLVAFGPPFGLTQIRARNLRRDAAAARALDALSREERLRIEDTVARYSAGTWRVAASSALSPLSPQPQNSPPFPPPSPPAAPALPAPSATPGAWPEALPGSCSPSHAQPPELQRITSYVQPPELQRPPSDAQPPELQRPPSYAQPPELQRITSYVELPEMQRITSYVQLPELQRPPSYVQAPELQRPPSYVQPPELQRPASYAQLPELQEDAPVTAAPPAPAPAGSAAPVQPPCATLLPAGGAALRPALPGEAGDAGQLLLSAASPCVFRVRMADPDAFSVRPTKGCAGPGQVVPIAIRCRSVGGALPNRVEVDVCRISGEGDAAAFSGSGSGSTLGHPRRLPAQLWDHARRQRPAPDATFRVAVEAGPPPPPGGAGPESLVGHYQLVAGFAADRPAAGGMLEVAARPGGLLLTGRLPPLPGRGSSTAAVQLRAEANPCPEAAAPPQFPAAWRAVAPPAGRGEGAAGAAIFLRCRGDGVLDLAVRLLPEPASNPAPLWLLAAIRASGPLLPSPSPSPSPPPAGYRQEEQPHTAAAAAEGAAPHGAGPEVQRDLLWRLEYALDAPAGSWLSHELGLRFMVTEEDEELIFTTQDGQRVPLEGTDPEGLPAALQGEQVLHGGARLAARQGPSWRARCSSATWSLRLYGSGADSVLAVASSDASLGGGRPMLFERPLLWRAIALRKPVVGLEHPEVGCRYSLLQPPRWEADYTCSFSVRVDEAAQGSKGVQVQSVAVNTAERTALLHTQLPSDPADAPPWWQHAAMRPAPGGADQQGSEVTVPLELTLRKEATEPMGITVDTSTLVLFGVARGGPGFRCGFGAALGRRLAAVGGRPVRTFDEVRAAAQGAEVRMTFAPPAAPLVAMAGWWDAQPGGDLFRITPPFVERWDRDGRKNWSVVTERQGQVELNSDVVLRCPEDASSLAGLANALGVHMAGLTVASVHPGGKWGAAGLRANMVLQGIGGTAVSTVEGAERALAAAPRGCEITFHGELLLRVRAPGRAEWADGSVWIALAGSAAPF